MCFHRRLLFTCNHHAWLDIITKPCEVEEAFARGERDTGCTVRWSHGFDTVRVQERCVACIRMRADDEYRFGVVKDRIWVLKGAVEFIRGEVKGEGEEKGVVTEGEKSASSSSGDEADASSDGDASAFSSSSSPSSATAGSTSSAGGSEETEGTSLGDDEDLDETMEEVRVDSKHRPLKLPQIVAERRAKRVEDEAAVQEAVQSV